MTSSPPLNVSEIGHSSTIPSHMDTIEASTMGMGIPTYTNSTEVLTTAVPVHTDATVIGVVIVLVVVTVLGLGFLLYRYLCHNKGDYRTTGELAPGEDPDDDCKEKATVEKKEYFI